MTEPSFKLVSRPLLMAWCGWLLASWAVNLAIDGPVTAINESMLPAVRWMLMSTVLGIGLIWPVCRLTLTDPHRPATRALTDLIALVVVFQVVIWPLQVLVHWPAAQTIAINATILTWALPIGLWVYLGLRSGATGRLVAMLACVLTLIGPAAVRLLTPIASSAAWTVFEQVWFVSDPANAKQVNRVFVSLAVVIGLSAAGWTFALLHAAAKRSSTNDASPADSEYHEHHANDWNI